jgi:hypothetical protein
MNTRWTRLKTLKSAHTRLLRFVIIGKFCGARTSRCRGLAKDKIHREALRIRECKEMASPRSVIKLLDLTCLW